MIAITESTIHASGESEQKGDDDRWQRAPGARSHLG